MTSNGIKEFKVGLCKLVVQPFAVQLNGADNLVPPPQRDTHGRSNLLHKDALGTIQLRVLHRICGQKRHLFIDDFVKDGLACPYRFTIFYEIVFVLDHFGIRLGLFSVSYEKQVTAVRINDHKNQIHDLLEELVEILDRSQVATDFVKHKQHFIAPTQGGEILGDLGRVACGLRR